MEGGGLYCPVEECERNRGGNCGIRGDGPLGFAAAAFYMPGQTNFMSPFAPPIGMINNGMPAVGQPPMNDSWGVWRNCPRLRANNPKR